MDLLAQIFDRHVFVDLETTGLDPSTDKVIELGALFVERGEIVRKIDLLFSPGAPLPLTIQRLTGLTDADVEGRPAFEAYHRQLANDLRGWTVVAHNAAFEQSFLGELLEDVRAPVLDSCELLHYLFPELESHSLEAVIRWAKAGDRACHRALRDCEDTFVVLGHAIATCAEEGKADELADLLACLDPAFSDLRQAQLDAGELLTPEDEDPSPLVRVLRTLHEHARLHPPPLSLTSPGRFLAPRDERRRRGPPPERSDEEDARPIRAVAPHEVDAVLGAGGALSRSVEGFSPRAQQLEMARGVASALSEGATLAVEAGTGTGKSLAYLAPAALFAARNGRRVGVAPHTKALQDQLIEKDLPKLHRATDGAFEYAVLKGQNNYVCRRRLLDATKVEAAMGHSERAPRAYLRAFARRSPDGDLDRLSYWFREHYPQLVPLSFSARSEAATTLGQACPHYRTCFYHSAVSQAEAADVVVINQALALAWPQRYPKLDALVLDEAHEVEDVVTTALAAEISHTQLLRMTERLAGRGGRRGLLGELSRTLAHGGLLSSARTVIQDVDKRLLRVPVTSQLLGEALVALGRKAATDRERGELRLTPEVRALSEWKAVAHQLEELRADLEEIGKLTVRVKESAPEFFDERVMLERELAGALSALAEVSQLFGELIEGPRASRCHAAVCRSGAEWALSSQPVDVSPFFRDDFSMRPRALVLTSATLSTAPEKPWILGRLGLDENHPKGAPRFLRSATPFDLERQALVVLVTDAPDPHTDAFLDWATIRISGLAQFMGGRVLGLFASARRLEDIAERVRVRLEPLGIEVLQQSRGNSRQLAARQEEDQRSVLLGTKSFWQGVDIPGRGVACVFIDKLPIEPHNRPIVSAREEQLGAAASNNHFAGFNQYRLPRALLQLRQGVGRLIRSAEDRGVVVIADPGSARYREQVLAALDGYRVEALPWSRARLRIHEALKAMNLADARPAVAAVAKAAPPRAAPLGSTRSA